MRPDGKPLAGRISADSKELFTPVNAALKPDANKSQPLSAACRRHPGLGLLRTVEKSRGVTKWHDWPSSLVPAPGLEPGQPLRTYRF